jgi:hypothetical protein
MKPSDLKFEPTHWTDDADGGSKGVMNGSRVSLEYFGTDKDPQWIVVRGNRDRGYTRGGRDGERTLDDVKAIAEQHMQDSIRTSYENALEFTRYVERVHQ